MNQSSTLAGLSSCRCSTILYEERKELQRNVKVFLVKLRIMFAEFFAVIGHSWDLDQKRNGTEHTLINLEFVIKLLKT